MAKVEVDWGARVAGWLRDAPLCQCGCGRTVAVNVEKATKDRVKAYKYRPFLPGHNLRQVGQLQLTARERSIIIGTLLGDAWCGYPNSRSTMPRLVINHGAKQSQYAEWKASELRRLNARVDYRANPGWGASWARVTTHCSESLVEFYNLFYGGGVKRINQDVWRLLDPLALAVWLGDDGSLEADYRFHTEGFDPVSVENLSAALWRFGVENTVLLNTRGHSFIRTYRPGTIKLTGLVADHLPEPMRYKLWQK